MISTNTRTPVWFKIVLAGFAFALLRLALGAPAEELVIPAICLFISVILFLLQQND